MPPASQYAPLTQRDDDDDGERAPPPPPGAEASPRLRDLFAIKHYPALFLVGAVFDGSRASLLFITSAYVTEATGSPRYVQLTGTCLMVMLLLGPCFGIISDRYDRRRTVAISLATMSAITYTVAAALYLRVFVWQLIYPFCLFVGLANVLDTTNRPALIYDLLSNAQQPQQLSNAMALRSLGAGVGGIGGVWLVGLAVERLGIWSGFIFVAAQMSLALLLLCTVPSQPPARKPGARPVQDGERASVAADLRAGLWLAWSDRPLASVLSTTIIANFFYFSHAPILQLLASELGVSTQLGALLLASQQGGRLFASLPFLYFKPRRLGLLYSVGIIFASCTMPILAVPSYPVVFGAEMAGSFGSGWFGAQSTLVMTAVPDDMRGRAMGLLTLSIGCQPIGMVFLGETAERIGVRPALLAFACMGIGAHALSQLCLPQARKMVR